MALEMRECIEWSLRKAEECEARGDKEAADNYRQLAEFWDKK